MSRLFLLVVLIAALAAAASLVLSVWNGPAGGRDLPGPVRRTNAIQKAAYVLLIVVMGGVATGLLGAD